MDFIIGGSYQGKRAYVQKQYNIDENDIICASDMKDNDMEGKKCLADFHLYVRNLMETEKNIEANISTLFEKNDIRVIISDEIGYGIVPIDAFEREYREAVGRQSCILAQKAERVVRVVSGMGIIIKEPKPPVTTDTPAT